MLQGIVNALLDVPELVALVDDRVRWRRGILGGLTTADLGPEGTLVGPALVVVLEVRQRDVDADRGSPSGPGGIQAVQSFALYCYAPDGPDAFGSIREVHRIARKRLHNPKARPELRIAPVEETGLQWSRTSWALWGPELVEEARRLPVVVGRYDAHVTDPL